MYYYGGGYGYSYGYGAPCAFPAYGYGCVTPVYPCAPVWGPRWC